MILFQDQNDTCQTKNIPVFDDFKSYLHAGLGASIPYLGTLEIVAISVGYMIYQSTQSEENCKNTVGDFIEFDVGMLLGYLGRFLFTKSK
jgi:hypothetical protein